MSFTTMQHRKVWKGVVKPHANESVQYKELIEKSPLGLFSLWCTIDLTVSQFIQVPSIENFATFPNWHFITEVCNMASCGHIKHRII